MLSVEPMISDVTVALRASRQSDLELIDTLKNAIGSTKPDVRKQVGAG